MKEKVRVKAESYSRFMEEKENAIPLTILQDDNAEHFGLSSCFCLSVKVGKIALFIKIPTSEVD